MAYPYYASPYAQPYQPYQPQAQQPVYQAGIVWVSGFEEASAYPIAPNTVIPMWDRNSQTVYWKQSDAAGRQSIRVLDYKERSFAAQTANTQAISSLSQQLSTCCCENRLATCQTQNQIAAESAATRQAILDKLCQLELDAKNDTIGQLRQELLYARGQASQVSQTAAIEASQNAQTQYIVNRVAPYPIPAYVVANPVTPAVAV